MIIVVAASALIILLVTARTALASGLLADDLATHDPDTDLCWYDIAHLDLEGCGWHDTESRYDRLPRRARGTVRDPVWDLGTKSAGLGVRFVTNAPQIHGRWSLRSESLAMTHMPATGVSGLDLYAREDTGTWRWLGVGRPEGFPQNTGQLAGGIPEAAREYRLYLPLYNGVTSVEIGVRRGHTLARAGPYPPDRQKPILFYGTSITQGGCASRPGMAYPAILGRWLQRPTINLGFSGNGRMEPELADLLVECEVAVYVLDCLPNMTPDEVSDRVVPFVQILRRMRPDTPILLAEDRTYCHAWLSEGPGLGQRNARGRAALAAARKTLLSQGVDGLYHLSGEGQIGDDGEGTVDGSHPNDLGFMRQAEAFRPVLEDILRSSPSATTD